MKAGLIESLFGSGLAGLGPERRPEAWPVTEVREEVAEACRRAGVGARAAVCLEALVLLWHDHWDEAHGRVQDEPGADAAFVHGILHRREPDYGNARYWFHRVGRHPVQEALADAAAPVLAGRPALPHRLIRDGRWDGMAFIDAVASVSGHPGDSEAEVLRELQRLESLELACHLAGVVRGER